MRVPIVSKSLNEYSFKESDWSIAMTKSQSVSNLFCCTTPIDAPGQNCWIRSFHWFARNSLCTTIMVRYPSLHAMARDTVVFPKPQGSERTPCPDLSAAAKASF